MRSQIQRDKKYRAKLDGDIAKIRADADGNRQKTAFRGAVVGQVEIEQRVRLILNSDGILPMFNHFYMDFGKRLGRIRKTHGGNIAQVEACIQYWKWSARGLLTATLGRIIAVMGFQPCVAPPPPCDWDWKRKLTFSGNVSATNLDNFPVLVHLTNANFDFNKARPLGQDIRFMDSDTCPPDGTPLKHEIELWDKPGANAWIWVKVPRIDGGSVNDFIYMFYGNNAAPDGQDAVNVWNATYKGVWHMRGDGTTNLPDSTTVNDGTKVGIGSPSNISENIDGSQEFDGNDWVNCGGHASLDISQNITVGCWVNISSAMSGSTAIYFICKGVAGSYNWVLWADDSPHPFSFRVNVTGRGGIETASAYSFNTWYYVVYVFDGTNMKLYVNGTQAVSLPLAGASVITDPLMFGRISGEPTGILEGKLDEIRVLNTHMTPDWIMAQWKSQDETLITYGAEE